MGRWYGIPKENRHCTLCLKNIGDEFHVLFKCENDVISETNSYLAIIVKTQTFKKMGGGGECFQTVIFNYWQM